MIVTIAGNGAYRFSGDGGPAKDATISRPSGLAVDASGNVYISESTNRIRKVSPEGTISTFAGNGTCCYSGDGGVATKAQLNAPGALAFDRSARVVKKDFAPELPGVYEVRVIVPDVSGDTVPVVITAAGQTSPAVRMAVRYSAGSQRIAN